MFESEILQSIKKLKKFNLRKVASLVALVAIVISGVLFVNKYSSIEAQAQTPICPAGYTWNGSSCQSNAPTSYACPSGGYSNGGGACIRNLCPDGNLPQANGFCNGAYQMIVYACGAGDPNTIYRTTHNGFDSSLCTAPQNRGYFSQVGACPSGFRAGGSRNRGGLPYTYNVRSGDGPEPFYDTYFGYGDSADTLLRDRRTIDSFQAMCNDGSRLCPWGQGLAFYAAYSTKHLPLAGAGEYLCVSYDIPNTYLPVFFAGGWSYSYRADPGYYPYPRDPNLQDGVSCRSYSVYATGGWDNFTQIMAGANNGGELSFYCAPNNFAPPVSSNYTATAQYSYVAPVITPDFIFTGRVSFSCGVSNIVSLSSTPTEGNTLYNTPFTYSALAVPTTTCTGLLPPNYQLDAANALSLKIGNIGIGRLASANRLESDACVQGGVGSGAGGTTPISCSNVPIGSLTGSQKIFAKMGTSTSVTNYGVFHDTIKKTNVYTSEVFSDGQIKFLKGRKGIANAFNNVLHRDWRTGATGNETRIQLALFKTYQDMFPSSNTRYVCNISVRQSGSTGNFIALINDADKSGTIETTESAGTNLTRFDIPYSTATSSCEALFTNANFTGGQRAISSSAAKVHIWDVKIDVKDTSIATSPVVATFRSHVGFKFAAVVPGG